MGVAVLALLLAGLEVVADGRPRVHVETDGSPPARFAADLVRRHVVLIAGTALPERGADRALRFELSDAAGYEIRGGVVRGADLVRAGYDILEAWGCRFGDGDPRIPTRDRLVLEERAWKPGRTLLLEAEDAPDLALPVQGVAVRGLDRYRPERFARFRDLGYGVSVASTTFDDFLPLALFEEHPEWFARRSGERAARGNFALRNEDARRAYLDRLGAWLEARPEVDRVGIWPEVTTVWDEDALALGAEESYALLWREAAARFPGRDFEILATGLTLKPPGGRVPENVSVRLRPGRDASALQGLAGQEIEAVVKAWEVRGARVVLEIDAQPESWCGMPWPCHDAIRANARRFRAAVLRHGGHAHARAWRAPDATVDVDPTLRKRARGVRSWGHPRDAADLFPPEGYGIASRIGAIERLFRLGGDAEARRSAVADAYLGFRAVLHDMPAAHAATYRRFRARDFRRALRELLPEGVVHRVGPAEVRESFDTLTVETDRLRLRIDRRQAAVVGVQVRNSKGWSAPLEGDAGSFLSVVDLRKGIARTQSRVRVSSPGTGRVRIELDGKLHREGPRWESVLELSNASGLVRQTARVAADGGVAVGCRWKGGPLDRWLCPAYVAEGRLDDASRRKHATFRLVPGTLLYCRAGEKGPGLALRAPHGAAATLSFGEEPAVVAASRRKTLAVDWVVFTDPGELGRIE